jgi:hypothetical protein
LFFFLIKIKITTAAAVLMIFVFIVTNQPKKIFTSLVFYVTGMMLDGFVRLVPAARIAGGIAARHEPGGIAAGMCVVVLRSMELESRGSKIATFYVS